MIYKLLVCIRNNNKSSETFKSASFRKRERLKNVVKYLLIKSFLKIFTRKP